MKRLALFLLLISSYIVDAQRVLKHTLIPYSNGTGIGSYFSSAKITDYRILAVVDGSNGYRFVYLNAEGDTIKTEKRNYFFQNLVKVNSNGVCMALNFLSGPAANNIRGFTMDSNGTVIASFNYNIGDPFLIWGYYFLDSYTDSSGNAVLHLYSRIGNPAGPTQVFHITINPLGQLVKVKTYGPTGLNAALNQGSKLLVKDGKLWGFTGLTNDGVVGIGIDTADFTGERYYLLKSRNFLGGGGRMSVMLPYKRNGYYTSIQRGNMIKTCKSDIMGVPIQTDSGMASRRFFDLWVSADSSRINAYWPNSISADRILRRIDHQGNIMGSIVLSADTFLNTRGFFCFGDGSWINISSNFGSNSAAFPYALTRISDMGYPYDPWKQQVVFKGVTGTEAQVKEKPKVIAYPNPTTDNLRFMGIAEGQVRLIDATGKTVLTSPLTAEGISLAHLPRGLYHYQLHYRNQTFQGRVVRE